MFRSACAPLGNHEIGLGCARFALQTFSRRCVPLRSLKSPHLHGASLTRLDRSADSASCLRRKMCHLLANTPLPARSEYLPSLEEASSRQITHPAVSEDAPSPVALASLESRYWSPKRRFFTAQPSRLHLPIKIAKLPNCKTAITCKLMKQKCLTPYTNEITWRNISIHAISVSPCLRLLRVLAPQAQESFKRRRHTIKTVKLSNCKIAPTCKLMN